MILACHVLYIEYKSAFLRVVSGVAEKTGVLVSLGPILKCHG